MNLQPCVFLDALSIGDVYAVKNSRQPSKFNICRRESADHSRNIYEFDSATGACMSYNRLVSSTNAALPRHPISQAQLDVIAAAAEGKS